MSTVTLPSSSASALSSRGAPTASTSPSSSSAPQPVADVALDTVSHFKDGARGVAGGVTFTVRMLPKLMVSGPVPEIEQAQLDCARGADRGVVQVDTLHKRAEWGGLVFELGYADVYHDDIELTVRRK